MSDLTDWLDAIESKWKPPLYAEPYGTPSDVAFLLHLAREQQTQIEAVRELSTYLDGLADGDKHYARLIRAALEDRT